MFWDKLKQTRHTEASKGQQNVNVKASCNIMQENSEIESVIEKAEKNVEEVHYDARTANERGFFFRINGQNCKITNYKGSALDVRIPDTINGKPVKEIQTRAFAGKKIRSVVFPKNLLRIGEEAFKECALEKIELPPRIERIAQNAFGGCEKLAKVTLHPDAKKNFEVDWKAFADTPFIKENKFVILGEMLLRINLAEKQDKLCIPRNVKYIKKGAAQHENTLNPGWGILTIRSIFIPANVKRVEDEAFFSLREIKEVQVEHFQRYHYVYFGKDVFGKTGNYHSSPFKMQLIREKLGNNSVYLVGWQWLKELEIFDHEGVSSLGKSHLFIPRSKRYEFMNCLQIKYSSLNGFGFSLNCRDYYTLMLQVRSFREKMEMAKFFAYRSCGSGTRDNMKAFLLKYEGRAWKYAVKKQDNELLQLYQRYGFWTEKVRF